MWYKSLSLSKQRREYDWVLACIPLEGKVWSLCSLRVPFMLWANMFKDSMFSSVITAWWSWQRRKLRSIHLASQRRWWLLIQVELSLSWPSTCSSETPLDSCLSASAILNKVRRDISLFSNPKHQCCVSHPTKQFEDLNALDAAAESYSTNWWEVGTLLLLSRKMICLPKKHHKSSDATYVIDTWMRKKKLLLWRDHHILNNILSYWYWSWWATQTYFSNPDARRSVETCSGKDDMSACELLAAAP